FYSGNGIYRTDGSFPELISRIGCQDFVDAISDPEEVYAGTDGVNVYFSIGDITLADDAGQNRTYQNVVLKFSPRDENWSIFSYTVRFAFFTQFGTVIKELIAPQPNGYIGELNYDTDNADIGTAIPYEMETQELDVGNMSHTKKISDKMVAYVKDGGNGTMLVRANDKDFQPLQMNMNERVNVCSNIN